MADEEAAPEPDPQPLDDEERAYRFGQEHRDEEQDDADNDVAPRPPDTD